MADAKPDVWMPMYWGKFFIDTTEFDDALTGAYAALLGHCWIRGGSLPDDDTVLSRLARATPARWKRHRAVLGQAPFFTVTDGRWTQKRLTRELAKATHALQTKIENGGKGGRPKKLPVIRNETERKPAGLGSDNRPGKRNESETKHHYNHSTTPKTETLSSENLEVPIGTLSGKPDDDADSDSQKVNGNHAKSARLRELRQQAVQIVAFLNERAGKNYQTVAKNIDPIVILLKTGATLTQCRQVIANRVRKWKGDPKMEEYLRPKTLFNGTNFANYVGELVDIPEGDDAA